MIDPKTACRRFIGRYMILDTSTGAPIGEQGYVALLLTEERRPAFFLGTAETLDDLLSHLATSEFALKLKDVALELDAPPEPYFDHGPRRTAQPSALAWSERERVLTVMSGR